MFGIGMPELLLILCIALMVIGPKKLPDLARSLGRAMREFKKATSELKESINAEADFKEVSESFDDIKGDLKTTFDAKMDEFMKEGESGDSAGASEKDEASEKDASKNPEGPADDIETSADNSETVGPEKPEDPDVDAKTSANDSETVDPEKAEHGQNGESAKTA